MDNWELLHNLQGIDQGTEEIRSKLKILEGESEKKSKIREKENKIKGKKEDLASKEKSLRSKNLDLEDNLSKQRKHKGKISEGRITNPKELAKFEREIEHLKSSQDNLEDEALDLMEGVEELKKIIRKEEEELKVFKEEHSKEEKENEERKKGLEEGLEEKIKERQSLVSLLEERLYERYEDLRESKEGLAVAVVRDEACSGCHVDLSTGILGRVKAKKEIQFCQNCGRILYWEGKVSATKSTKE